MDALEYATRKKLNGTHHLLVCADDVNLLDDKYRYHKEKHGNFN
jgi:hypothetical protein